MKSFVVGAQNLREQLALVHRKVIFTPRSQASVKHGLSRHSKARQAGLGRASAVVLKASTLCHHEPKLLRQLLLHSVLCILCYFLCPAQISG